METYELVKVEQAEDWQAYHNIRRQVLWEDRGKTTYDDKYPDEYLPGHHPLLLKVGGQPVGTTRLDEKTADTGIVRLVAIARGYQRNGHGRKLSEYVEAYACRHLGMKTLLVNAAPEAIGYYEKMGWSRHVWDPEELQGIASDCIQMRKIISG